MKNAVNSVDVFLLLHVAHATLNGRAVVADFREEDVAALVAPSVFVTFAVFLIFTIRVH